MFSGKRRSGNSALEETVAAAPLSMATAVDRHMTAVKPLSPARRAYLALKPVFALLFLAALTLPYVSLYRLKHGAYLTEETAPLFVVSFAVSLGLGLVFFLVFHRKESKAKSLLALLCAATLLYPHVTQAKPTPPPAITIQCPPDDVVCGSLPPPPQPPYWMPPTQPSRPVPRVEVGATGELVRIRTPVTYRMAMTSTAGDHVTLFKDGPIEGYWAGGFTNNATDAWDTQIFNMTDINGGALMSGDDVQFQPYRSGDQAGYLWAVDAEGFKFRYLPPANARGAPRLPSIRIRHADGHQGAIAPDDTVVFQVNGGGFSDPDTMFFVPHSLGTTRVCNEPNADTNNHIPRVCKNADIAGMQLTFGNPANIPAKDREFHLAWAVDERAFYFEKYWVDREVLKNREQFEAYAATFDGRDPLKRGIDQMLSEMRGFQINWARTWLDAMHASADGAAYIGAAGTIIGLYSPIGGPAGAAAGVVLVGTINAAAAASESIEAQKKEYAKEQAAKNKAAWESARNREMEDPNFVGPPRPETPTTGYGDEPQA